MYDSVLIPTDGSEGANRAVRFGLALAEQYDAEVHAMNVVDTARYGEPALSSAEIVLDELEAEGHDLIADIAEDAEEQGIVVSTRVCHGVPPEEIVEYADEHDVDVVVMGYQGTSHQHKMGSTVQRVLEETDRPVLAV
ncbi:universal stress protein [Halobacteriales archaeon Cl-PHB]